MIVNYATGKYDRVASGERKPMIRIQNNLLYKSNFKVGDFIDVEYGNSSVLITRR
ncbi:MAG: hypothetical protein WCO84_02530 [bacterium]